MSDAMKIQMIADVRAIYAASELACVNAAKAYHAQYAYVVQLGATPIQIQEAEQLRARYTMAP